MDSLFALVHQLWFIFLILAAGTGTAAIYGIVRHTGKVEVAKPKQVNLPYARSSANPSGEPEPERQPDGHPSSVSNAFTEMVIRGLNNSTPKFRFTNPVPIIIEGDSVKAKMDGEIGEIYFDEEKAEEDATPPTSERPPEPTPPTEETEGTEE